MSTRRDSVAATIALACGLLFTAAGSVQAQNLALQGFEVNTGDWTAITTRVPSGGGTLAIPAASGNWYGELTNIHDTYLPGFGGAEYSYFGYALQPPYPGDFSQSISLYVVANWPVAIYNGPGVWIDMSPGQPLNNYGGEHNFRLTPTGTSVQVTVDGQTTPIVTITTTGWYKFQMTYRKGALPTDLVSTDMNVFNPAGSLLGTTTVVSDSPGGPLLSQDLAGPNYVWITVWPNGFANDVMAIDDVRADLLTPADAFQIRYSANLDVGDSSLDFTNTGANNGANLCVNLYTFDPAEELISCCSCSVTPNGLQSLSVLKSLISNPLTPAVPSSVVIKAVASAGAACNPSTVTTANLAPGMLAWGATLHQNTSGPAASYSVTEAPFSFANLSTAELTHITSTCGFIQATGSGFGICQGCSAGGLGAPSSGN